MSDPRINKRWKREHRKRETERRNPEMFDENLSGRFLFKGGSVMAILRPRDVALKLAGVAKIKEGTPHEIAAPMFDALLDEQEHLFVGYAAKGKPDILDKWGNKVGDLLPGDSFVGLGNLLEPPMFMRTGVMHQEIWEGRKVLVLPRPDLKLDSNTGIVMDAPDPADKGSIVLRGGATEVDCHIPTLNRIWCGDPNIDYRTYKPKPESIQ